LGWEQTPEGLTYFNFFYLKLITLVSRQVFENFVKIRIYLPQISINEILKKIDFFLGGGLPDKGGMIVQPYKKHFLSPSLGNIPWKFRSNRLIIIIYSLLWIFWFFDADLGKNCWGSKINFVKGKKKICCKTILLAVRRQSVKSGRIVMLGTLNNFGTLEIFFNSLWAPLGSPLRPI